MHHWVFPNIVCAVFVLSFVVSKVCFVLFVFIATDIQISVFCVIDNIHGVSDIVSLHITSLFPWQMRLCFQ